jgi:hypothetical protein
MRLRSLLTTIAFLAASTLYANADTVFDVTGYMPDFGTVNGTVTINTVTGAVTDADMFLGGVEFNQNLFYISSITSVGWITEIQVDQSPNPYRTFDALLPIESLVGFTGGQLCSTDNSCGGAGSPLFEHGGILTTLEYGELEPATPASIPEPSTFALLATGLLALAGTSLRRLSR